MSSPGALVYDPCIGSFNVIQKYVPAAAFARANNAILNINETYLQYLEQLSDECGFTDWTNMYLQYPPPGNQPAIPSRPNLSLKCESIWSDVTFAAAVVNPCFNFVSHTPDFERMKHAEG